MGISRDRFRKALDNFYSQEMLYDLFKTYFIKWIAEGYIGINLGLFEVSLLTENSPKIKFLDLLEQSLAREEVFIAVFKTLPEGIKKIFNEIAWNGKYIISQEERAIFFRKEQKFSAVVDLNEKYAFFKYGEDNQKNEYLYIDNDIVRWYRQFLPKNRECFIYTVNKNENWSVGNNEESIIENLGKYFNFFNDGKLELSTSGKLLKSSKIGMHKYCNIEEYYKNLNDLDFLKTETIALFFYILKKEYLNGTYLRGNNLKNIILDFLNGDNLIDDNYTYSRLYLNYLKGYGKPKKNNSEVIRGIHTIRDILQDISPDKIISVDNLINYIIYNDKFIEILNVDAVYEHVYINEANYERTKLSTYENYQGYIIEPFIKSILFILGTFGVLEIYYTAPTGKKSLYLRHGYLSKYDGIKGFKLTKLGEYIFGKRKNYEFKQVEEGSVYLEDDFLLATVVGEAPVRTLFLESIGTKISPTKFKISSESFLKKISNRAELEEKIQEFRNKISENPGEIWENLFKELLERMTSVKILNDYSVLQIKQDKNLINFISSNREISKLILKAENFHIIIKNENIKSFEEILNSNGYFLA
ncbi:MULTISPECIES: hypothetical protein [Fusobacterium]|uniref:hypothetical protein n=1 Tax=Fusobacterium TaxID=848 RepID=UPI001F25EB24|nr:MULTISPECIES: hypothetical protein [Fusobacterium]MCF2612045.1 hypothetical protein [Fusobacterium perfoetens]MDY2980526.1 hypothetical protein [Fusobacterium sp.]